MYPLTKEYTLNYYIKLSISLKSIPSLRGVLGSLGELQPVLLPETLKKPPGFRDGGPKP